MTNKESQLRDAPVPDIACERHYSVNELAMLWRVSRNTIIRWFEDEPGVFVSGQKGTSRDRGYLIRRIPESVVIRVHRNRRNEPAPTTKR